MAQYSLGIYALLPLAYIIFKLFGWGRRGPRLPPGPPTIPIIGNMLQMPKEFLQLQYVFALPTPNP